MASPAPKASGGPARPALNDNQRRGAAGLRVRKAEPAPIPADDLDDVSLHWKPSKLDLRYFPDQPAGQGALPPTIPNVRHLLAGNGVDARYNVIKKRAETFIPGLVGVSDNADNVTLAHVRSLMALHGIPNGDARAIVDAIANENPYNPVADWIGGAPWDGVDRLPDFYATLTAIDEYPQSLKEAVMYHWALSAVAAVTVPGFSTRLVLTLSGPQSIGKTRWCMRLVSDPALRDAVVKTDHHFEGGDKDHIITAMRHWIVELGEVESSLRKDAERIKGIITRNRDVMRIPYAAADVEWPRRTVFVASANGSDFLSDPTGSTRWGVIPVEAVDHEHDVDMQQLFAQLAVALADGAQWWLDRETEARMEAWNERHRADSIVREAVERVVDLEGVDTIDHRRMTALGVLETAGLERPTTVQAREAGGILRARFGPPAKSKVGMRWLLPIRGETRDEDDAIHARRASAPKSKFD